MNDKQLRQDVIDELDFEPRVHSADIGVVVEKGVVTLTGHVPNYSHKLAAERAVWRVNGVKAVAQEIQVRVAGDKLHNDDEIARRAIKILAWDTLLPRDAVRVQVQDGWVKLSGTLDWNYQRESAEEDVRKLGGVLGVSNDISLSPAAQAIDVKQLITDALNRHAEVEASRVTVSVQEGGTVGLEGDVDNWDERQAVVRAAWSAAGVRAVVDRLRIGWGFSRQI
ncbi:MAG TPA: BON domain-containing protein [Xanthomonadaceae bacterium]|nr:BON domain-containing protein [Xanthomonadaceae bacterium]